MNRSVLSVSLSVLLPILLTTGCNSGSSGGSSRSSARAPAAPNPGGTVAALSTQATPVNAQVALGVHEAFREHTSVSDLVIPDAPGLRDRAFTAEESGFVRVLSLAGATPSLDRAIPLEAAPLPAGVATGALVIHDERTALVTASGAGGEAVYLFDPSTAQTAADVTKVPLHTITVTWPAGTLNSQGVDVGGQARPLSFTAGAALAANRLFIASSNFDASFDLDPGSVLVYDVDPNTRAITGGAVFRTTDFNPTAVTRVSTPQGPLVLVTNAGVYGSGTSSVDVFDATGARHVATIPLGQRNVSGPVVVSPDGRRGYLGSQSAAEVFVLDLEGLGGEAQNQTVTARPARFLGGWVLPGGGAFAYVSGLALSHTGDHLYAVNFNASELYVLDLTVPGLGARVTGFARTGQPSNFEGLASKVAVRPGVPGRDFAGPSLFVLTVNLAVADRTIADVKVALDAVTVDRH
ncbi:MAG: hypothetical protein M9894_02050 [Planctomycetes bacterium]|nr:hypothetical protein [Planctomycetota bacterium]